MSFFDYFKVVIAISLFWGITTTLITYSMQDQHSALIERFTSADEINTDYESTAREFESSLNLQKETGGTDLGALALYSGNIVFDLAANVFFAIPNMFSMLLGGIFDLFHVNAYLQVNITEWIRIVFSIFAAILLIQFLLGARTQSLGAV